MVPNAFTSIWKANVAVVICQTMLHIQPSFLEPIFIMIIFDSMLCLIAFDAGKEAVK